MKPVILRETVYDLDGKEKTRTETPFVSKSMIIKNFRRKVPLSGYQIYELSKTGKMTFEYGGVRRDVEIVNG